MEVTRDQLTAALEEFCAVTHDGRVAWTGDAGTVTDVARALYGQLAVFAAVRASEDVVDASICCDHEHLPEDRELALMAAFLRGMRWLDADTQQRVRRWVDERFVRTEPPF